MPFLNKLNRSADSSGSFALSSMGNYDEWRLFILLYRVATDWRAIDTFFVQHYKEI